MLEKLIQQYKNRVVHYDQAEIILEKQNSLNLWRTSG
jgi:hypothetical protein